MKATILTLVLFLTFFSPITAQDSLRENGLRAVFMDLPIEKNYPSIVKEAEMNENIWTVIKAFGTKSILENQDSTQLVFEEYPLLPKKKCTNCYISSSSKNKEHTLRLVLNFESFDQVRYNDLLKIILDKIAPQVTAIEQAPGDRGTWETLFFLDNKAYTPRIRINDPSKAFTQLRIDYISAL